MEDEIKTIGQVTVAFTDGASKVILIERFKALDCWRIQSRFIDFATTGDQDFKKKFTLEVLGHAHVMIDATNKMRIATEAVVDNHLRSSENVEAVFEAVLSLNGIDPKTHAKKSNYWANAAEEMASSFVAEIFKAYGPQIQSYLGSKG